jgi:hypothetical protein
MAIWWGSLIFSAGYLMFFALNFGGGTVVASTAADAGRVTSVQA